MSTSIEEIQARMAMDTKPFSQAITKAKAEMADFSEHGRSGFVKAQSSGREFQRTIRELGTQDMPFLGRALQTVINGFENWKLGLIAVAVSGVSFLVEKLDAYMKALDKVGEENAKPIWGKEQIAEAAQAVRELRREHDAFIKSLNPGQVPETVRAITEEKDPKVKLGQARAKRDAFAAERDARLVALQDSEKQREHLEVRKTRIPGELSQAQRSLKFLEGQVPEFITDPEGPAADPEEVAAAMAAYERSVQLARDRVQRLTKEQGLNPVMLRDAQESARKLQRDVSERQTGIRDLQNLIDPLAPNDSLPRGKRQGTFSISVPGLGAPAGMITVWDKMGMHLERISNGMDGRYMLVRPVNGP